MSRNVVVTTSHRGVFWGVLDEESGDECVLLGARMAVYWSADCRGVLGLASSGPTDGCRITPSVPRIRLTGVTSIADTTDAASAAWEKAPWG